MAKSLGLCCLQPISIQWETTVTMTLILTGTPESSAWLVWAVTVAIESTEAIVIRASSESSTRAAPRVALTSWMLIFTLF